ncbi:MAG: efflux RND transporter permease subunit, partial [Betaproteobacteria bacterium]|nr:efflux RND transporter permease subunit [Betaproteobacteria bacterium]
RDRTMSLAVRADAVDGVQAPSATQALWPQLQPLVQSLPPGYRIERGGAWEESGKANKALFAVFPLMLGVTLLLLMIQLQSFSRVALVFLTFPLGLVGAVPALLASQSPFGFVALLGLIAAAAAILAMIPLSRSVFWGPMAITIMGGLLVATALTLLAVPAAYAAWFKVRAQTPPTTPPTMPLETSV